MFISSSYSSFLLLLAISVGVVESIGAPPGEPTGTLTSRPEPVEVVSDTLFSQSAYLDPGARLLVEGARSRLQGGDRSIFRYSALARQRISVGLSTLRRERLLYRSESSAQIRWRRHGAHEIEILGAREVIPIALPGVSVPRGLEGSVSHLLFDPSSDHLLGAGLLGEDGEGIRHPLSAGSEAHYQFASGDTTVVSLPDGTVVELVELRVLPRSAAPVLLSGSFWLEAESHSPVQGVFRLARPWDLERDTDRDQRRGIRLLPGLLKPFRADIRYLTIDYGYWDLRWWLPRQLALEGVVSIGRFVDLPIRFELSYSDYEVMEDPVELPFSVPLPRIGMVEGGSYLDPPKCLRSAGCRCVRGDCRKIRVSIPSDSSLLLSDPTLPPSIYDGDSEPFTIEGLGGGQSRLGEATLAAEFVGPRLLWGLDRTGLVRYNRVEGLSTGLGVGAEYGRLSAELVGRIGWAIPRQPAFTLDLRWRGDRGGARLGLYHDLALVDPSSGALGLGNSLSSLLWGQDDGDYLRALGADLAGWTGPGRSTRLVWRLYAERQEGIEQATSTSLRRLWSSSDPFRPNFEAEAAELVGAELGLRFSHGLAPDRLRLSAELGLETAAGSHRFIKSSLILGLTRSLPGPLSTSVELGAGTSLGTAPVQKSWFLGGGPTLRGYRPLALRGESFWRGRAELGAGIPAGRFVLFSDLGWAGERDEFPGGRLLLSAGGGLSLLDGLLRVDLARAFRAPTGWRMTLGVDLAL